MKIIGGPTLMTIETSFKGMWKSNKNKSDGFRMEFVWTEVQLENKVKLLPGGGV